jgi:hypothetical protein
MTTDTATQVTALCTVCGLAAQGDEARVGPAESGRVRRNVERGKGGGAASDAETPIL